VAFSAEMWRLQVVVTFPGLVREMWRLQVVVSKKKVVENELNISYSFTIEDALWFFLSC
jgi:hypothetical protein